MCVRECLCTSNVSIWVDVYVCVCVWYLLVGGRVGDGLLCAVVEGDDGAQHADRLVDGARVVVRREGVLIVGKERGVRARGGECMVQRESREEGGVRGGVVCLWLRMSTFLSDRLMWSPAGGSPHG